MNRWLRRLLDLLTIAYVGYGTYFWISSAVVGRTFSASWFGVGAFVIFAAVVANLSILSSPHAPSWGLGYLIIFLTAWFVVMPLELLHEDFPTLIAPALAFAAIVNWRGSASSHGRDASK